MILLNEFCAPGTPDTRTAQQKGVRVVRGRVFFYEKPEVAKAKSALFRAFAPYAPLEPYEGALYVKVLWLMDKKSLAKCENNTYNTKRPDVDNLAKGCLDVMTELKFWNDDAQLSEVHLTKGWSRENAGIYVQIYRLEQMDFIDRALNWRKQI